MNINTKTSPLFDWPSPPLRASEEETIRSLHDFGILDTERHESFDVITRLATKVLHCPISLISFVDRDRQWWKSSIGMETYVGEARQLPRNEGYCGWVVGNNEPLLVLNAANDIRFEHNPAWSKLKLGFYAGVPIRDDNGLPLGSFCVVGPQRDSFTDEQFELLKDLGSMVLRELKLRINHKITAHARDDAIAAAKSKSMFLANMSHEIRTPMSAIIGMIECFSQTELTAQQQEYVEIIQTSSDQLLFVINSVLDFSKLEGGCVQLESMPISIAKCVEMAFDVQASKATKKNVELIYQPAKPDTPDLFLGDSARLQQILLNLIGNAVKFTKSGQICVHLETVPTFRNSEDPTELMQVTSQWMGYHETTIDAPTDCRSASKIPGSACLKKHRTNCSFLSARPISRRPECTGGLDWAWPFRSA